MNSVSVPVNLTAIATERLDSCPLCRSQDLRRWCTGRDRLYGISRQKFIYSTCQSCRAVFLSHRPKESEISQFYPEDYCAYQTLSPKAQNSKNAIPKKQPLKKSGKLVEYIFPKQFDPKYQPIYNPSATSTPILLDFGCGAGKFLTKARHRGWQTIGIDFSPVAIDRVLANGHEGFLLSDNVWENIEDESIDFIRMNHVLEHLYHPLEILELLQKKMKPGGTLHISLPNPDSITAKLFGSRWFSLDCPRHIILYPPKLLIKLLEDLGFSEFYLLHEIVTKDFARSCVYLAKDFGLWHHQDIERVLEYKILDDFLSRPAEFAASLGASDRFHVFVKKSGV